MKTYSFKVVIESDEDAQGNPAWHAWCPALASISAATSGRTRSEALRNINDVVRMIVQEFIEEGKPLPEGPADCVEVAEISQEEPRIASVRSPRENSLPRSIVTGSISSVRPDLTSAIGIGTVGA
ncbi:MAG: type II toxin-antitoxin system HicB family antitoxin [Bryobacteraceae bacterium]|jgi:predicted RNase H-like HicB family nuclease